MTAFTWRSSKVVGSVSMKTQSGQRIAGGWRAEICGGRLLKMELGLGTF